MAYNVAINGFGRIGRLVFRLMSDNENFNIVAINDLTDVEQLSYLLKYDTAHRRFDENVSFDKNNNNLIVGDKIIKVFAEKDPRNLPWGKLEVDAVYECTGVFTDKEKAMAHIDAGAKHVVISAPAKGDLKTIVYNVNHHELDGSEQIISAASCTTNCLAPVLKVLDDEFGIEKGMMTTVHAYTNDQSTLDIPHKKGIKARRGRAAAENIIPTSTGAASAIGKVLPNLSGKLDGLALRVPVCDGSIVDLSLELSHNVTVEQINEAFKNNQNSTLKYTEDPVVSCDVVGTISGALVDGLSTNIINTEAGQLVKVLAWYDNEMGYSAQMVRTTLYLLKISK